MITIRNGHTPSSMMYLFLSTLSRSIQKRHLFHFIKHVIPELSIMLAGSLHSPSPQSTKEQTDPSNNIYISLKNWSQEWNYFPHKAPNLIFYLVPPYDLSTWALLTDIFEPAHSCFTQPQIPVLGKHQSPQSKAIGNKMWFLERKGQKFNQCKMFIFFKKKKCFLHHTCPHITQIFSL